MKFVCPQCDTEFEVDEKKYKIDVVCCPTCYYVSMSNKRKGEKITQ